MKYLFDSIEVCQISRELVNDIYFETNSFPRNEKFELISKQTYTPINLNLLIRK